MEYGILGLLAIVLGAGVAGGVLTSWGCIRRLLALEEWSKVKDFAVEARLKELERMYLKAEKREAAEIRWSGKKIKEETDAQKLLALTATGTENQSTHPWDPRTWGR